MELNEKLQLNKQIRKYEGENSFLISLKKNLASKWCQKIEVNGRSYKVLSDRQYEAAKILFN
jgi:hypothetical protein